MFLPTDHKVTSDYPRNCTFREEDWHILAGFWYPIAYSHEVTDKPYATKLLDTNLVIYRSKGGGLTVARDLCIHRGSRLSMGWMDDKNENIVCPLHGLHYNANGQCTWIPSLPLEDQKIPKKMCIQTYQVREYATMIWTCLKPEAIWPMPDYPHLDNVDPDWLMFPILEKGQTRASTWNASASRHCENYNDIPHLSWVHMKTFGNRDRPVIAKHEVEHTDYGLKFTLPYYELERGWHDDKGERERLVQYTHMLTFPFATDLQVDFTTDDGEGMTSHFFDIATPISAKLTAMYQFTLTNVPDASADEYVQYYLVTVGEDVPLVESQCPEEIPLNMAEEIHVPADNFSAQFRKSLSEKFGLGAPEFIA